VANNTLGISDVLFRKHEAVFRFVYEIDEFISREDTFDHVLSEATQIISKLKGGKPKTEWKGCWIHKSVKIHENVFIEGPCVIAEECEIGPSSYIRGGTIIGKNVKIGFGVEVKASYIGNGVKISHRAYVGNSHIGENSEISAGVTVSAKRLDRKAIKTWQPDGTQVQTGHEKLGSILGKECVIGSGAILMPGSRIGDGSKVMPGVSFGGFADSGSVIKTATKDNLDLTDVELGLMKTIIESLDRESDRFWKRNTLFVTISAALFALTAGYGDSIDAGMKIAISVFGLVVALAWCNAVVMGKYYWLRIETDLKDVLKRKTGLDIMMDSWFNKRKMNRPKAIRPTTCVFIVAIVSSVIWVVLLFSSVYRSFS